MDGYDVGGFQFDHIYNVPDPLGRYLIVAGYGELATRLTDQTDDKLSRRPKRRR